MWLSHSICDSKKRLLGNTVVITGANTGIGKETARDLYYRGARVILACRNLQNANEAIADIKQKLPSNSQREQFQGSPGELAAYELDLSNFTSVRECAEKVITNEGNVHILINNAGVGCPKQKTVDGFDRQFQTNHLGPFLLTLLLLPKLKASAPGCRIINVASSVHAYGDIYLDDLNLENSYTPIKAYQQSKLANVLVAAELARKLRDSGIEGINCYSLHPGVVATTFLRHFDSFFIRMLKLLTENFFKYFVKNVEQGAQTSIYCAVDENAGQETGLYYRDCKPAEPSAKAQDKEIATKLWNESLKMVEKEGQNLMDVFFKA